MDKEPTTAPTTLEEVNISTYKELEPSVASELLDALDREVNSIEWELGDIQDRIRELNARRRELQQNRHLIAARARAGE